MSNKEIIKKLRVELEELRIKIMNLKIFLGTQKYQEMYKKERYYSEWMLKQQEIMEQYEQVLIMRIILIQDKIDKGDE